MKELPLFIALIPSSSNHVTHSLRCFDSVEENVINAVYKSLGNRISYGEFIGAWIFDQIEIRDKWIRSGICYVEIFCPSLKRNKSLIYDIYMIRSNSYYMLPLIEVTKLGRTMYQALPHINFATNPRYYSAAEKISKGIVSREIKFIKI